MPETAPVIANTSDAAFDLEWAFLRAACSTHSDQKNSSPEKTRLRGMLQKSLNWDSVLQLAERQGVAPILYESLNALQREESGASDVPPGSLSILKQRYETNLHRTLFLTRELIRILDHLGALSIHVLPYKGVALAETLYGDLALRQAGDIDLLIRPGDLLRIKNALLELGYTPHEQLSQAEARAYLRSGYECAFDSSLGRNLLEVQWALQPHFYAVDFETESLFRRAVTVNVAGRDMKTPSPEDLFLILSLHAAKHVWGRLIWLSDLSRLLKSTALNWDGIGETAKSLGIVRILQVTLVLTNLLLETPIPAAAKRNLRPDPAAIALANEIALQIGRTTPPNVESFSYFRLMMRLRERRTDRIRFLRRLAFTPGPGEWKAVRLPTPLFPLYRLIRFWRLAARLTGASHGGTSQGGPS